MARSLVLARPRTHRRKSRGAVSRAVTFGPAVAVPVWGWEQLGQVQHLAGLAVMTVLGVAIIPAVIVLVIFLVPHGPAAMMPRKWRKKYRHRRPREDQRSARISKFLRRVTYAADRNRCVYCHRKPEPGVPLQVDHYLPWSQGGLTTPWNTMSLCRDCNLTKSNYWRGVFYRPVEGFENVGLAAAILDAERRHRYNPLRLTRAAWALGA